MLTPLRRFGLIAHRSISVLPVGSGVPSVRSLHSSTFRRAKIVSFDQPEPQPRQPPQTYDHTQTPGSTFKPLGVDQLNRRDVNYGIGTPAAIVSGGAKKRRHMRPYGVQGIRTPMTTKVEGPRELGHSIIRTFIGKVTSDRMQKTIAVEVSQFYKHPKYKKYIRTSKKFLTHDEAEECSIGDIVEIRVCRPFSKRKHFTLHRIIKPKLAIDEAAAKFIQHQPQWKQHQQQSENQA